MLVSRRVARRMVGVFGAIVLGVGLQTTSAGAQPSGTNTCHGGAVTAGTYRALTIAGFCTLDAGSVTVTGNATLQAGSALVAEFGSSDLTVRGNLMVGSGAILLLGCHPVHGPCLDDPTATTHDSIGGNLIASGALMVVVGVTTIGGNVIQSGGGGGVTCDLFPLPVPNGPPAYSTYADDTISGNLIVTGLRSCYMGLTRDTVLRNIIFNGNVVADPDGNEIVLNQVRGNLICVANSPAPQVGDSPQENPDGTQNTIGGHRIGQCAQLP